MRTFIWLVGLACALAAAAPASGQTTGDFFTVTGTGLRGTPRDGQLATQARLGDQLIPLSALPGGGFLIVDSGDFGNRVRMVDASGVITTVAGGGVRSGITAK